MSENFDCKKLGEELDKLKQLKSEFDLVYAEGVGRGDLSVCKELYRELKDLLMGDDGEIGELHNEILRFKSQYVSQVDVAWKSGMFGRFKIGPKKHGDKLLKEKLSDDWPDMPYFERRGEKHFMPTWSEVASVLRRNREVIKEKNKQGFTKMLIVPIGYNLSNMCIGFQEKVNALSKEGRNEDGKSIPNKGIYSAGGVKVGFGHNISGVHRNSGWSEDVLDYYPQNCGTSDYSGMKKEDVIKLSGPWQVCFVEDMSVVPEEGKVIGGRIQLDKKGSCIDGQSDVPRIVDYQEVFDNKEGDSNKKCFKESEKYKNEIVMIPEQYIWMQMTSLCEGDRSVLMDYDIGNFVGTYILGAYNRDLDRILRAGWNSDDKCLVLTSGSLQDKTLFDGVRTVVNVK